MNNLKQLKEDPMFTYLYDRLVKEWAFSDDILIDVIEVNTPKNHEERYNALAQCNEYLDFMEGYGFEYPKDAWVEWCASNYIEHEGSHNPYEYLKR